MRLFDRFQKQPTVSDDDVKEIQERVRNMRQQVGRCDVELADLFALLGEDERPLLRDMEQVTLPEIKRIWPDQVPSHQKPADEASAPPVTYGGWDKLSRRGLVTLP